MRAKTPKLLPDFYLQRSLDWTWSHREARTPSSTKKLHCKKQNHVLTHFRYGGESCKPVWPCERMVKSPFKVSSSSVWTDYWVRKWHQQLAIAVFSPFPSPFLFLLANSPKAVACKFQFLTNEYSLFYSMWPVLNLTIMPLATISSPYPRMFFRWAKGRGTLGLGQASLAFPTRPHFSGLVHGLLWTNLFNSCVCVSNPVHVSYLDPVITVLA